MQFSKTCLVLNNKVQLSIIFVTIIKCRLLKLLNVCGVKYPSSSGYTFSWKFIENHYISAVFDGRKHTWFDFVVSNGNLEIFAWTKRKLEPIVDHNLKSTSSPFITVDNDSLVNMEAGITRIQVGACI